MNKIFTLMLVIISVTLGAIQYVRDGASGSFTGSDWTNAYDSLPTALTRGDTFYIADGNYPSYEFNDALDGVKKITIKKATTGVHGTETGWINSYGDGTALWATDSGPNVLFTTGFYTINGATGTLNDTASYGIKFYNSFNAHPLFGGANVHVLNGSALVDSLTLKYIMIKGCGWGKTVDSGLTRLIYFTDTVQNFTLQNSLIMDAGKQWINASPCGTGWLIERNYFWKVGSGDPAEHSNGINLYGESVDQNMTIRYNIFRDMLTVGGTNYVQIGHSWMPSGGYDVYSNVFYDSDPDCGPSWGVGSAGDSSSNNNIIANNTFYSMKSSSCNIRFDRGVGNIAINNLFYLNERVPIYTNVKDSNNIIINTDIDAFNNALEDDFSLKTQIPGARTLTLPTGIAIDGNGVTRGAVDGCWDFGAFESILGCTMGLDYSNNNSNNYIRNFFTTIDTSLDSGSIQWLNFPSFGGRPKLAMINVLNSTSNGVSKSDYMLSFGAVDSSLRQWSLSEFSDSGAPAMIALGYLKKDTIINIIVDATTSINAIATGIESNGIYIRWAKKPTVPYILAVTLMGGDSLSAYADTTEVKRGTHKNIGFNPDFVISAYCANNLSTTASAKYSLGFSSTTRSAAFLSCTRDASLASITNQRVVSDSSCGRLYSDSYAGSGIVKDFTATGFTQDYSITSGYVIAHVAVIMRGVVAKVDTVTSPTTTGVWGLQTGFKPQWSMLVGSTAQAVNTNYTDVNYCVSSFDADSGQYSANYTISDNAANDVSSTIADTTKAILVKNTYVAQYDSATTTAAEINFTTAPATATKWVFLSIQDDTTGGNPPAAPVPYVAFGNSNTYGYGLVDLNDGYAPLLASHYGLTLTNKGQSGFMLSDMSDLIMNQAVTDSIWITGLFGYNDARLQGGTPQVLREYQKLFKTYATSLAIPDSKKTFGSNTTAITYSGSWGGGVYSMARKSSTTGSTATCSVTGSTIYLSYLMLGSTFANLGKFNVTVDGVDKGTYLTGDTCSLNIRSTSWVSRLVRVSGLTNTSHTVVITHTGTGGGELTNWVEIEYVSGIDTSTIFNNQLNIAGCLKQPAAGYPGYSSSDSIVDLFNAEMVKTADTLFMDGLPIKFKDPNINNVVATDFQGDNTHLSVLGHQHMYNTFIDMIDNPYVPIIPPNISYQRSTVTDTVGYLMLRDSCVNIGSAADSFTVSPTLPSGLIFTKATGTISGTPLVISNATVYTIIARNSAGSDTTTLTLSVRGIPGPIAYVNSLIIDTVGIAMLRDSCINSGALSDSFTIAAPLPSGLLISKLTGAIYGTPSSRQLVSNYKTYVWLNNVKFDSTTVSIRIKLTPVIDSIRQLNVYRGKLFDWYGSGFLAPQGTGFGTLGGINLGTASLLTNTYGTDTVPLASTRGKKRFTYTNLDTMTAVASESTFVRIPTIY